MCITTVHVNIHTYIHTYTYTHTHTHTYTYRDQLTGTMEKEHVRFLATFSKPPALSNSLQ